jgi:hypothetical protein
VFLNATVDQGKPPGSNAAATNAEGLRSTELDAAQLRALADLPSGAVALAGAAVGLLLIAWLFIYFLVYLPRGMVG